MASRRTTAAIALIALATAPMLAACGKDKAKDGGTKGAAAASGSKVQVQASDTTCGLSSTALAPGATTFEIKNTGSKTTEVYVYGAVGDKFTKVLSEKENIGPGTSREMKVDLAAGSYEVACKPGQKGDGIRTKITVGDGSAPAAAADSKYDREIELATDGKAVTGLTGGAKVGEKIEFKLTNNAASPRVLELKDASDAVAGETPPIAPGATGEIIIEMKSAGSWKVIVEGDGAATITVPFAVA